MGTLSLTKIQEYTMDKRLFNMWCWETRELHVKE